MSTPTTHRPRVSLTARIERSSGASTDSLQAALDQALEAAERPDRDLLEADVLRAGVVVEDGRSVYEVELVCSYGLRRDLHR